MKVTWLIENDIYEHNDEKFVECASKLDNVEVKFIKYIPFKREQTLPIETLSKECIVIYSSLNMAKRLRNSIKYPVQPGVYFTPDNFKCSTYYAYFGKYHVNSDCYFLPWAELCRRYKDLGFKDHIFIRPDGGDKEFTGHVISINNFEKEIADITTYSNMLPTDMIIVSEPVNISHEYRLVICNDEIITGSQYIENNKLIRKRLDLDSDVIKYGYKVLNDVKWRPDNIWTLDICITNNKFKVIEIGCFSCAGLYDCDIDIILDKVSKAAWKEHQLYHGVIDE